MGEYINLNEAEDDYKIIRIKHTNLNLEFK